ncbi:hypothetical protein GWK48_09570 [Metallosphaera tengchongensis]|uniref:Uncharacterized protein n=1 Tax=Metallosphaera tengchongensis TaxID=1532350 RepID=A0A6N0NWL8_9CREN|nr:hypothetical protein [Metallosphaera tengchongensis]QKR00595.1 hypothetical protein GWK48_09570 [Metallosphaera tengchongensis]
MRVTSRANPRALSWSVAAGIGYSFILTIVTAVVSLLVKAFYPPFQFSISPIRSLVISPVEGVVQILVILVLLAFALPVRSVTIQRELKEVRKLVIYVSVGYLVLSLLPYAITTNYLQTYVGLVIAFNVINGVVGGVASSLS